MNYLELTNRAIQEAGVDMDDLTSVNFANPTPAKMYTRFKTWVAQAWKDIQIENTEWEFENGTAVVSIFPQILVNNGNRSVAPPAASTYTSASGGVSFVVDSVTTNSGSWAAGTAEALLRISALHDNGWILKESFNEVSPNIVAGVFKFKYYGRYDPRVLVSDLEEANFETFIIQDPVSGSSDKLPFLPWAIWKDRYELLEQTVGRPMVFTETPDGKLDFYPRPDREYVITFSYTKAATELAQYGDTPNVDSRYHDIIYWRAVMFYADYDENQRLWTKASRRYFQYMMNIDRDLGPRPSFGRSAYDNCE